MDGKYEICCNGNWGYTLKRLPVMIPMCKANDAGNTKPQRFYYGNKGKEQHNKTM